MSEHRITPVDIFWPLMNYSIGSGASAAAMYTWAAENIPAHLASMHDKDRMEAILLLREWATDRSLSEEDLFRIIVQSDLVDLEFQPDFELRELVDRTYEAVMLQFPAAS